MPALAFDLVALALDVAGVLGLHLDLFGNACVVDARAERRDGHQFGVVEFGPAQQVVCVAFARDGDAERGFDRGCQRVARRGPVRLQASGFGVERIAFARERGPARVVDQAEFAAGFGQAQVGVVLAQRASGIRRAR
jgi:hypothetical protein